MWCQLRHITGRVAIDQRKSEQGSAKMKWVAAEIYP